MEWESAMIAMIKKWDPPIKFDLFIQMVISFIWECRQIGKNKRKNGIKKINNKGKNKWENPFNIKKNDWVRHGMELREGEDWESIYLFYITCELCENCECVLTDEKNNTSTRRNLDHDHKTGFVRNVLCHACNMRRG